MSVKVIIYLHTWLWLLHLCFSRDRGLPICPLSWEWCLQINVNTWTRHEIFHCYNRVTQIGENLLHPPHDNILVMIAFPVQ